MASQLAALMRAVLLSGLTIAALSMMITALVWPFEADQLLDQEDVVVLQAVVNPAEQQPLFFSRAISKHSPSGSEYRITTGDLRRSSASETPWDAVAMISTPAGVVVGELNGTLRRVLSPWSARESEIIGQQPDGVPIKLSCSADGRRLLSLSQHHLYLWDLQRRVLIGRSPRAEIEDAVLSFDGARLFSTSGQHLVERDAISSESLRAFDIPYEPMDLACSPDGKHLAMLFIDGRLAILQLTSGEWLLTRQLSRPGGLAATVAFCPRGESIVTARQSSVESKDWTVEVTNVLSGRRAASFTTRHRVFGAAISDDNTVLYWGADASFCQWSLQPQETRESSELPLTARRESPSQTAME